MGVFLGSEGLVELKRTSLDDEFLTTIGPGDVRPNRYRGPAYDAHNVTPVLNVAGRFSFDFPHGQYISGDRLDFSTRDGSLIPFLDGWNRPYRTAWSECVVAGVGDYRVFDVDNGTDSICTDAPTYASPPFDAGTADYDNADVWVRDQIDVDFRKTMNEISDQISYFVHVDEVGGITIHKTFTDAVSGAEAVDLVLIAPLQDTPITVTVANVRYRCLGQVTSFTLNNTREAVDVTELGDAFREQYSGLISGSGDVTCLFDYSDRGCDPSFGDHSEGVEMPVYVNQLILRSSIGSEFDARFTLVRRGDKPGGSASDFDDLVCQEFRGLVTNVGYAFAPGEPVKVTMSYVSTGPIRLHAQLRTDYITQEQAPTGRIEFEEYSVEGYLKHTD